MASKTKENPLLFSANISSPFDEISSSALLLPPKLSPKPTESSPKEAGVVESLPESLQPHLVKNNSPATSVSSVPNTTVPFVSSTLSTSQGIATPPHPPIFSGAGIQFSCRPTNKYVVPPEISASSTLAQPKKLCFPSPRPPPAPTITTFTPLPNDSSLLASQKPTLTQFATDLSSPVKNIPQTTVIPASFNVMADNPPVREAYHPVIPHWFFCEGKPLVWKPFSFTDSFNLEESYRQGSQDKIATDGGRYDVMVSERIRKPIYWEGEGGAVRRCSWFHRSYSEARPLPYTEDEADLLEAEYKDAIQTGHWHRQVELPSGERVMLNSQFSMHHYPIQEPTEVSHLSSVSDSQYPQTVKRGSDDFTIKEGASGPIDHLLFLIHGIGSVCDFSFRSVEECVEDFRTMGDDLMATHFRSSIDAGQVGRVEILPISWHKALHGDATGLDEKLKTITLRSIPKFREFTNDTLLDVLFYTSPVYCQHIMDTVASEMEKLLKLFHERNPDFGGSVSVGGHSLGSVILFDLLMHQNPAQEQNDATNGSEEATNDPSTASSQSEEEENSSTNGDQKSSLTSQINFMVGAAGTGQPAIIYPQLSFQPQAFFLMGSPLGMFITVRGIDRLGPSFKLPTCSRVFNIFHPFDPVAYRLETLIDPSFTQLRPILIPHHKGRKRMHLELMDTIERVGSDLKNKIVDSLQSTWNKFYQIYSGSGNDSQQPALVDQSLVAEHLKDVDEETEENSPEQHEEVGKLNRGLRIDYVLQEKPYESFTEYIFALQAHVSYWNSEDTLLMILKELYKMNGISSDDQPIQPLLHRPSKPESLFSSISTQNSASPNPFPKQPLMEPNLPPMHIDSNPVPMLSNPVSTSFTSSTVKKDPPRTLRGRPLIDPLKATINKPGMDPTVSPSSTNHLPKPPILPAMSFNRKKIFN